MAYLMTAMMTGGVAAIIALFSGAGIWSILWNYVIFGHLGMATLAFAMIASAIGARLTR
ncbi:hypothetical protein KDD17_05445 [Sulfitobacter albidus]|uniref:Uncharacterized protein n=1 Tax=Sulfitobacter albidus TaxID=2829501 RepID=A0A975JFM9_9RHOB|nr:hypothetical protein [Sulfitobacter albidus]QUJ77442.1 hypothetical protein KDD17_05445 [Sulfitobacter albidus]